MKIQGRKGQHVSPLGPVGGPSQSQTSETEKKKAVAGDRVDLTSTQQIRELSQQVKAMPAVRAEKVDDIRDAIDQGSYHVASDQLARKVVDDVLSEALLKQLQPTD